jgi:hypothetical protein
MKIFRTLKMEYKKYNISFDYDILNIYKTRKEEL